MKGVLRMDFLKKGPLLVHRRDALLGVEVEVEVGVVEELVRVGNAWPFASSSFQRCNN
jgi:hypothetical protein